MYNFLIFVILIILFGISIITSIFTITKFYNDIIEIKSRIKVMNKTQELSEKVLRLLFLILALFSIILLLIF